jgi:hypothetical protein
MIESYPLHYPLEYPRTKLPKRSRFNDKLSIAFARDELLNQLRMLKAKEVIISTNIPLRRDGLPYSNIKVDDMGVAVYFIYNQSNTVLCCDLWNRVQDNLHAIERTVNAIRQMERDGVSEMLKRAFTGFKALPEHAGEGNAAWWVVLGIESNSTKDQIKTAYRKLSMEQHPDKNNGAYDKFIITQKAYEEAISEK